MSGTIVIEEGVSIIEQEIAGEGSSVIGSMVGDYISTIGAGMSSVFGGGGSSSGSSGSSGSGSWTGPIGQGLGQGGTGIFSGTPFSLTGQGIAPDGNLENVIDALRERAEEEDARKKRQKKVMEAAEYAQKVAKLVFLSSELNFTDEKGSYSDVDPDLDADTVTNIGLNFIEAINQLDLAGQNMVNVLGNRSVMEGALSILFFNLSRWQIRLLGIRGGGFLHRNPITQLLKGSPEKQEAIRKAMRNSKNPAIRGPNTAAIQNVISNIEQGLDSPVSTGSSTGIEGGTGEWTPPSGSTRWGLRSIFSWGLRYRGLRGRKGNIELTDLTRESMLRPRPRPPTPPDEPPDDDDDDDGNDDDDDSQDRDEDSEDGGEEDDFLGDIDLRDGPEGDEARRRLGENWLNGTTRGKSALKLILGLGLPASVAGIIVTDGYEEDKLSFHPPKTVIDQGKNFEAWRLFLPIYISTFLLPNAKMTPNFILFMYQKTSAMGAAVIIQHYGIVMATLGRHLSQPERQLENILKDLIEYCSLTETGEQSSEGRTVFDNAIEMYTKQSLTDRTQRWENSNFKKYLKMLLLSFTGEYFTHFAEKNYR